MARAANSRRPLPARYRFFNVRLSEENLAKLRIYAATHNMSHQDVIETAFELLMAETLKDRKRAYDPHFYEASAKETKVLRSVLETLRTADNEVVDMLDAILRWAETERRRKRTSAARKNRAA